MSDQMMTPEVREQIRSRVASGTAEQWDAAVLWQHIQAVESTEDTARLIRSVEWFLDRPWECLGDYPIMLEKARDAINSARKEAL